MAIELAFGIDAQHHIQMIENKLGAEKIYAVYLTVKLQWMGRKMLWQGQISQPSLTPFDIPYIEIKILHFILHSIREVKAFPVLLIPFLEQNHYTVKHQAYFGRRKLRLGQNINKRAQAELEQEIKLTLGTGSRLYLITPLKHKMV